MARVSGSFTLLDIVIIFVSIFLLSGIKRVTLPISMLISMSIGVLIVLVIFMFNLIEFDVTNETIYNAGQLVFIFSAVYLVVINFTKHCQIESFFHYVYILTILSTSILIVSLYIETPLVMYDQVSRYLPRFNGLTSIYTISLASFSFGYLQNNITLSKFLFLILIVFVGIMCTQQRSMLVSLIFVLSFVLVRKNSYLGLIILISPFVALAVYLYSFAFSALEVRAITQLVEDAGRLQIFWHFLASIVESPSAIFTGLGIERWVYEGQEVHNQILHLISDYGVFLMAVYFYIVYRFVFFCFARNPKIRLLAILLTISLSPFVLFHTYSLERGHILLFMIASAYFSDRKLLAGLGVKSSEDRVSC